MGNSAKNVTAAKPKKSGAIFVAPIGTELPTDAKSVLAETYKCLGYCSEDGVKNKNSAESEGIKAWGGDTVLNLQKAKEDTFTLKLIEALNIDVLKTVYGSANVKGTDVKTGLTITANSDETEELVWVIDMVFRNNTLKRIVIPDAKISEVAEIVYKDNETVGYENTLSCIPDEKGNTHYEYIQTAS